MDDLVARSSPADAVVESLDVRAVDEDVDSGEAAVDEVIVLTAQLIKRAPRVEQHAQAGARADQLQEIRKLVEWLIKWVAPAQGYAIDLTVGEAPIRESYRGSTQERRGRVHGRRDAPFA
jgi:hypothetical protein